MHRHNKLFLINPFLSLKLPKIVPTRKIDFVTDNDIKELNGMWRSVSKGAFMKGKFTKKELNI
jgi:hypothetical protein